MKLHAQLIERIEHDFASRLAAPPQTTQDAITLSLDNGVVLTIRYAAADAYSLRWSGVAGDVAFEAGIDTAPTHPDLATRPNHLHRADGSIVADPLTRTDALPADNVTAVIRALLHDPQLSGLNA
jgi:hypothetical protein